MRKLWAEVNKKAISDLVHVRGAASCSNQSSSPSARIRNIGKIKNGKVAERPGLDMLHIPHCL